jgi:hypothetical protein
MIVKTWYRKFPAPALVIWMSTVSGLLYLWTIITEETNCPLPIPAVSCAPVSLPNKALVRPSTSGIRSREALVEETADFIKTDLRLINSSPTGVVVVVIRRGSSTAEQRAIFKALCSVGVACYV